jgi:hypothetical protein
MSRGLALRIRSPWKGLYHGNPVRTKGEQFLLRTGRNPSPVGNETALVFRLC